MVTFLPFRGLRYQPERLASLTDVTAPPYDVIDDALQQKLYAQHPANVVRLILNRETPTDSPKDSPYTRAATTWATWQQQGVIAPDPKPAFYAYSQTFNGIERKGLIGLLKIEPYETRRVLRHERTIAKYIADRLTLTQSVGANLSQVFMIYGDPTRFIETRLFDPEADLLWLNATDDDGVEHRWRPVCDPALTTEIQQQFAEKTMLIADGHHRYQTALTLKQQARDACKARFGDVPPDGHLMTDYLMVFVANMDDAGLQVFPTHRVLKRWPDGWTRERFMARLHEAFDAQPAQDGNKDSAESFTAHPDRFFIETPEDNGMRTLLSPNATTPIAGLDPKLRELDAAVLDQTVFEGFFERSAPDLKTDGILWFDRDEANVRAMVARGEAVAAFYMHAPSVHQVADICESGLLMPQKSTYFYPKILSGTVFNGLTAFTTAEGHSLSGVVPEVQPIPADLFSATAGASA